MSTNEEPVRRVDGMMDAWWVSGYAEVMTVLRDGRRYSAAALGVGQHEVRSPEDGSPLPIGQTLLTSDAPEHTRLRRFLEPSLGRAHLPRYERTARLAAEDCVARARPQGRCEVMGSVCSPVGAAVLSAVFGGGAQSADDVARWMRVYSACNARTPNERTQAELERTGREIWEAAWRSATDDVGVMPSLAAAHRRGELDAARVVDLCGTLVQGGADTTKHLVGNALLSLHAHPELRAAPRPEGIAALLEECLRREAPVQMTLRCTTEPVELGGISLPAGARLLVLLGAANRDPRANARHASFGAGAHRCPGAAIARIQARVILEALLFELRDVRVDIASVSLAEPAALRGPERLEIAFSAQ